MTTELVDQANGVVTRPEIPLQVITPDDADAIVAELLGEILAVGMSDAELYDGLEPRLVRRLKALVTDGSVARGLLAQAAEMRRANRITRTTRSLPSQVYFIGAEATGLIKIGCASNPTARLRSLQTGSPDQLLIIATIPGDMNAERALHRQFAGDRVHGEWFRQGPDLVRFLEGLLP